MPTLTRELSRRVCGSRIGYHLARGMPIHGGTARASPRVAHDIGERRGRRPGVAGVGARVPNLFRRKR